VTRGEAGLVLDLILGWMLAEAKLDETATDLKLWGVNCLDILSKSTECFIHF